jgi:hypothetical protein
MNKNLINAVAERLVAWTSSQKSLSARVKNERTNMKKILMLAAASACLLLTTPSHATMIQYGLYDTGVDGSGNSLAGGITDTHWSLNGGAAVVVNPGFLIPPWVVYSPANGLSRWISVDSSGGNGNLPISVQTFTTSFTLSGLANVTLSGLWASDNASDLVLNGNLIGSIPFGTNPKYSFGQYTAFAASTQSYFNLNGLNTLVIVDYNGDANQQAGNPGGWFGVRAESLTITGTPVPEPTTIIAGALLLLPFGASTLRILRKNRTA